MNLKSLLLACGLVLLMTLGARANNMLVQNVTTLGNDAVNKTIQVQFDISWDNSWRDAINYDAAWIFMKFKDANGLWQHVQLNQTGFVNGTGTANTVQVTSDKVGCWLYRSGLGSGTFNSTGMQLQWNYGLAGLNNVTGLEVRVFAVEMVYVPEGEFNVAKGFYVVPTNCCGQFSFNGSFNAPGSNFPVINTKLTPTLTYNDGTSATVRIKGDAGIDTNNDGVIDNTTYPIGYRAFYCYKYEMTQQQYADFLNTLSSAQILTLGTSGIGVTLNNGQYFSSQPNIPCGSANAIRLFAYADWCGLRPMSILEFNKSCYGPYQPILANSPCGGNAYPAGGVVVGSAIIGTCSPGINNVGYLATSTSTRQSSGASYYGIMDLTGVNRSEPVIKLNNFSFNSENGNGVLSSSGVADISTWNISPIYIDQWGDTYGSSLYGFRYVRSSE
jgi:hypothetical protein